MLRRSGEDGQAIPIWSMPRDLSPASCGPQMLIGPQMLVGPVPGEAWAGGPALLRMHWRVDAGPRFVSSSEVERVVSAGKSLPIHSCPIR
jgi:hypothetical protein